MRKHLWHWLLLLGGAAIFAFFLWQYRVYVIAPLLSIEDAVLVVARTFALRRLQRPLWALLTLLGVAAFIGSDRYGALRRAVAYPFRAAYAWCYRAWRGWPLPLRLLALMALAAFLALVFWLTAYRVAAIVGLWLIAEKIWYWMGDRFFDQVAYRFRVRYWVNRVIRRTGWLWRLLRQPRHFLAMLLQGAETERSEREARKRQERGNQS